MSIALRVPPPIVFMSCVIIIYLLPNYFSSMAVLRGLALCLAILSVVIDFSGLFMFYQKKTTLSPLSPEKSSYLVTSGIYRFTRNPMYVGLAGLLTAWSLWLGNLFGLLVVWGFIAYITHFQIVPEERVLAEKFGNDFRHYQQKVPRWLW